MQLLPGRCLQAALPRLTARLLEQLLTQPPRKLWWLGPLSPLSSTDKVRQAVTGRCCADIVAGTVAEQDGTECRTM